MVRCEAFSLFVKYAIIDGDVSLNLNVFLFLPVVLILMSVTYFFLYHSVMVSLNSAIRDYRVKHKRDAEVNDGLSSSERTENETLTEGEKEDRKRNLDVCYLSSLFASAFLSISGYRPFLNSYTIVLFDLSVVLLAIYLFSMIHLLILEKRDKVLSGKQLASFLLLSLMQIVVSFVLSQVLGYTILMCTLCQGHNNKKRVLSLWLTPWTSPRSDYHGRNQGYLTAGLA